MSDLSSSPKSEPPIEIARRAFRRRFLHDANRHDREQMSWVYGYVDCLTDRPAPEPQAADGLDRGCFVIMELMQAYERRIRSDCTTPEQLAAKPWRCAEYIKAERYLIAAGEADKRLSEFLAFLRQPGTTSEEQPRG